jgi:hypothetical protein
MKLLPAVLFGSILFSVLVVRSQEMFSSGARIQGLAGASVGLSDCWSVYGNQAGLAQINQVEIGCSFQNRFLINELSTRSLVFAIPVQSSVFAVTVSQFGKNNFRQEKYGLAYARQIFPKLNFGVQFNYYQIYLPEDKQSVGSSGIELGVQYLLSHQLILGIHVMNPYQTGIATMTGTYQFPRRLNFGANFHLSNDLSLSSEFEHDLSSQLTVRSGMEYTILEKLFLRTGFSGKPYQLTAGLGFRLKNIIIDLASSYNQYLGNSPSVSFQYQF